MPNPPIQIDPRAIQSSALTQGGAPAVAAPRFAVGYIIGPHQDALWFLALPFLALAVGALAQHTLTIAATVTIAMLVTVPHHFATWLRAYGFRDERERWHRQLFVGPFVIVGIVALLVGYWPMGVAILIGLWDHQHGIMQQYGFSRIYDLKAGTGAPSTRRVDLWLSWVLYLNLLLATAFWTSVWVAGFAALEIPLSAEVVGLVHTVSWSLTGAFMVFYVGHLVWTSRQGYSINPLKYAFLAGSYFLWYLAAWSIETVVMYQTAHRLMHGLQYDVMVHSYIRRKVESTQLREGLLARVAQPGKLKWIVAMAAGYVLVYAWFIGSGLKDFSFGMTKATFGFDSLGNAVGFEVFGIGGWIGITVALTYSFQVMHYFVDSFIWKVRDRRTQEGL